MNEEDKPTRVNPLAADSDANKTPFDNQIPITRERDTTISSPLSAPAGAARPASFDQGFGQAGFQGGFQDATGERATSVRRPENDFEPVAWLYCRKGIRRGHLYQFHKARTEFGRGSEADISIEDRFASGNHGAVVFRDGTWQLFDFASRNGTLLNGKRLGSEVSTPQDLKDGDSITIGDTEFIFKCL